MGCPFSESASGAMWPPTWRGEFKDSSQASNTDGALPFYTKVLISFRGGWVNLRACQLPCCLKGQRAAPSGESSLVSDSMQIHDQPSTFSPPPDSPPRKDGAHWSNKSHGGVNIIERKRVEEVDEVVGVGGGGGGVGREGGRQAAALTCSGDQSVSCFSNSCNRWR